MDICATPEDIRITQDIPRTPQDIMPTCASLARVLLGNTTRNEKDNQIHSRIFILVLQNP